MKASDTDTPAGCDKVTPKLLSVDDAKQKIMDSVSVITGREKLAIRSTLNRVLATDIQSSINVPPYDNSAMDGYAIMHNDCKEDKDTCLPLAGQSFAGKPFSGSLKSGQTIRIMTGAVIPAGADTIVMQEQVRCEDNKIFLSSTPKKGKHIRRIGEDIKKGETILTQGKQITPAELGLLASLGIPEINVIRKLRVAFFSTGDELRSVGETLSEGQIYDSNRYTLYGMLKRLGVDMIDMGVIADRRDDIRIAFREAAMIADAVITSGGVSVGEADFVKDTLEELGQVNFWRVAMKPGKPLAIGTIHNAAFFGVPGNPVSAMATFYQFVQPALKKMMGISKHFSTLLTVTCDTQLKKAPGRLEYQRGVLSHSNTGELLVSSTGVQGSHILTSMSLANCFIILPADNAGVKPGDKVQVQPFSELV